jgi:transcription termination/antitermination protein NusA
LTENNNTYQFIKQLAEREGVSEEKIKEIITDSFRDSYCQGENAGAELHFEFDSGLSVYRRYKIVEVIKESEKEITKDNELLKKGKIKDNILFFPLDIKSLSFLLNQEISNRLRKDIKKIGWERQSEFETELYNLYRSQQGEIIRGRLKSTQEKKYYSISLGKGIGYWKKSEWTSWGEPKLGQYFYFLIKEVRQRSTKDTPQITLTRSDDLFIQRILEQEILEIKKGIITVRHILRLPGLVSKIIVESKNPELKPKGACIGENASRIKSISSLINNNIDRPERIDIAAWTKDKKKLLFDLVSPVKPTKLIIKKEGKWEIIVPQKKVSLLLQHEGKLLKKISEYLEVNVHVIILEEIEKDETTLADKGKILQEVGSYKNIEVQIMEEIEK